jgi:hypothetical protein
MCFETRTTGLGPINFNLDCHVSLAEVYWSEWCTLGRFVNQSQAIYLSARSPTLPSARQTQREAAIEQRGTLRD